MTNKLTIAELDKLKITDADYALYLVDRFDRFNAQRKRLTPLCYLWVFSSLGASMYFAYIQCDDAMATWLSMVGFMLPGAIFSIGSLREHRNFWKLSNFVSNRWREVSPERVKNGASLTGHYLTGFVEAWICEQSHIAGDCPLCGAE